MQKHTLFDEIINNVKDALSLELGDRKVFDKDVAEALGINQKSFATKKARGTIPYDELVMFAISRKISMDKILFGNEDIFKRSESEKV